MNALGEICWHRRPAPALELRSGVDAYDAAEIQPNEQVVLVGAFVPFLKALKRADQRLTVLKTDPATLKADELPLFPPREGRPRAVPGADAMLMAPDWASTLLCSACDAWRRATVDGWAGEGAVPVRARRWC
jgi:hypothetical protein